MIWCAGPFHRSDIPCRFNSMGHIGHLVKRAREAKGWTQQELANRMGIDAPYISQVERGKINLPEPDRLEAIERALGVSRAEMLRELGYLGPPDDFDFIEATRRVLSLESPDAQEAALMSFPDQYLAAVQSLVELSSRLVFRRAL
jgi:transcriptional regulator with XRE-family HTH domain